LNYKVTHTPASTALLYSSASNILPATNPNITSDHATVSFSKTSFSVGPNETYTLTSTFTPPTANLALYPVYSGYIVLKSGSQAYNVPYFGLANALSKATVLDTTTAVEGYAIPALTTGVDSTFPRQTGARNYTLTKGDSPTFVFRLAVASALISIDLVASDVVFKPTLADVYDPTVKTGSAPATQKFSDTPILAKISTEQWFGRSSVGAPHDYEVTLRVDDTFKVPNGSYRILARVLKIGGNPVLESEYESWLSPIVNVILAA